MIDASSSGINPWLVHVLKYVPQIKSCISVIKYMFQFNVKDATLTVKDIAFLLTLSMNFCTGDLEFYT